jgi:N-acetylmuramoyl-L-alanine amidase
MPNEVLNMGVNDGHTENGPGSGAAGKISESKVTREVGKEVRALIKQRGHNDINCTIDHASSSINALELIVKQADRQELDWFISIHFNAGGGRGCEVYTYEGRQYQDALDVCKNISALGFINRGVKNGTGLYVIKKTKAKSMLIEVCFVDTADAEQYLKVGAKSIAKAIVDGILGEIIEQKPKYSVNYCLEFQKFYNQVTKTKAPISEDGSFGPATQKALDTIQKLIKGEY